MKYPRDYAENLTNIWNKAYSENSAYLTAEDMREILDCVFYASLLKEEGRPITTSIQISRQTKSNNRHVRWSLTIFEKFEKLSPDAIRKLSPAINPLRDDLIVEKTSDGLFIIGIEHGPAFELPYMMSGNITNTRFRIRAIAPGNLIVESFGDRILYFSSGNGLEFHAGQEFYQRSSSSNLISRAFSELSPNLDKWKTITITTIIRIAHIMQERGHGGILLISEDANPPGINPQTGYAIESEFRDVLSDAMKKHSTIVPNWQPDIEQGKIAVAALDAIAEIRTAADYIASLTQIDGAVCLGPDFSLLKFGAMISGINKNSAPPEISFFDPYTQATAPLQHVGMRHRAAISFCMAANKAAVAFVASQDGMLTLVAKTHGEVSGVRPFMS